MGLGVYVGSFTRYHTRQRETVVPQTAREPGTRWLTGRTDPEPPDKITDPVVVHQVVDHWRRSLEAGLKSHLPEGLSWDERADAPCFTDKPNWVGYTGIMLLAASTEQATAPGDKGGAFQASATVNFKSRYFQLFNAETWLPCDFQFIFKATDVVGNQVLFGSSVTLLDQLKRLNDESYRGSDEDLAEWKFAGASPKDSFERSARFGLAMFLHHAQLSVRHRLPMKLDY
jgi:hypothetical protein